MTQLLVFASSLIPLAFFIAKKTVTGKKSQTTSRANQCQASTQPTQPTYKSTGRGADDVIAEELRLNINTMTLDASDQRACQTHSHRISDRMAAVMADICDGDAIVLSSDESSDLSHFSINGTHSELSAPISDGLSHSGEDNSYIEKYHVDLSPHCTSISRQDDFQETATDSSPHSRLRKRNSLDVLLDDLSRCIHSPVSTPIIQHSRTRPSQLSNSVDFQHSPIEAGSVLTGYTTPQLSHVRCHRNTSSYHNPSHSSIPLFDVDSSGSATRDTTVSLFDLTSSPLAGLKSRWSESNHGEITCGNFDLVPQLSLLSLGETS